MAVLLLACGCSTQRSVGAPAEITDREKCEALRRAMGDPNAETWCKWTLYGKRA